MASDNVRKSNILCEYDFAYGLANKLHLSGFPISRENISLLEADRNNYFQSIKENKEFHENYEEYSNLCKIALEKTFSLLKEKFSSSEENKISSLKILNYNKQGRIDGVCEKSDVHIIADEEELKVSLKLYKKGDTIQVASGTYLSTLCGLAFDPISPPGTYLTSNGTKFNTRNIEGLKEIISNEYDSNLSNIIQGLKDLDNKFKPLVKEKYCGDEKWKDVCEEVAYLAIPLFFDALDIISQKDQNLFARRLVNRLGFSGRDEIVIVAGKNFYSSINNQEAKEIFIRLNKDNIYVTYQQSGLLNDGQGLNLNICDEIGKIVSFNMPLTINKNGAWQLDHPNGIEKKGEGFIQFGEPRPKKSKEIATSTNCWLKISELFKSS